MLRWFKKPENLLSALAIALFTIAIIIHLIPLGARKYQINDLSESKADNTDITEVWPD